MDSDDEDLVFKEQSTLRMPPGEDCDKLKKALAFREVGDDVWFKFKGVHGSCRIHGFIPFGPEHQCLSFVILVKSSTFAVIIHRFCY